MTGGVVVTIDKNGKVERMSFDDLWNRKSSRMWREMLMGKRPWDRRRVKRVMRLTKIGS